MPMQWYIFLINKAFFYKVLNGSLNPISRGLACQLISRRGGGVNSTRPMVFALATRRSHEKFSAFTHIKYRQSFSDIKRENQNCRKIGSVARKIKKSILSNFFLHRTDIENFRPSARKIEFLLTGTS